MNLNFSVFFNFNPLTKDVCIFSRLPPYSYRRCTFLAVFTKPCTTLELTMC